MWVEIEKVSPSGTGDGLKEEGRYSGFLRGPSFDIIDVPNK